MYRVRTSDVWFNMPGTVAAYQAVMAPDPIAARQNVRANMATPGQYAATPGTAPAWNARTGWAFVGASSTYWATGALPTNTWTVIMRLSGVADADTWAFGNYASNGWGIQPQYGGKTIYYNGFNRQVTATRPAGVWALAGPQGYYNGVEDGTPVTPTANPNAAMWVGDISGAYRRNLTANMQAFAIYARTLTTAEIWQASLQMKYCDLNPDWSAWGPRQRYFIPTTAAAAGLVFGPVGSGVIGSSVIRSQTL